MVVVSLAAAAEFHADPGAKAAFFGNDHDQGQTRRQETKTGRVAN
jgi:hypothetical protein